MMHRLSFIPIAIGLMLFPSLVWDVLITDGGDSEFYGFPIPWNSRGLATSLTKDVYLIPLLVDVAFYLLIAFFIWRCLSRYLFRLGNLPRTTAIALIWLYGLIAMIWIFLHFAIGSFFYIWYDYEFHITGVQIGLGV